MVLLSAVGLDTNFAVAFVPRLMQALVATAADCAVAAVFLRVLGQHRGRWAFFMHLITYFIPYTMVRTYSNSVEAALTWAGLALWPLPEVPSEDEVAAAKRSKRPLPHLELYDWHKGPAGLPWKCLVAAALGGASIIVRPTSGVVWAFLGAWLVVRQRSLASAVKATLGGAGVAVAVVVGLVALDSAVYAGAVFEVVPLNFVNFNMLRGLNVLYGTHPWHWYVTQGLPAMLGPSLPLFLFGMATTLRESQLRWGLAPFLLLLVYSTGLYSLPGHKEFRFLLPLMPVPLMVAGVGLASLAVGDDPADSAPAPVAADSARDGDSPEVGDSAMPSAEGDGDATAGLRHRVSLADEGVPSPPVDPPSPKHEASGDTPRAPPQPAKRATGPGFMFYAALAFTVSLNAVGFVYLALWHQRGPVAAVEWIAAEAEAFRRWPGTVYEPPSSRGSGHQYHDIQYIRHEVHTGFLGEPLRLGLGSPTSDNIVLRHRPLAGPRSLTFKPTEAALAQGKGVHMHPNMPPPSGPGAGRYRHGWELDLDAWGAAPWWRGAVDWVRDRLLEWDATDVAVRLGLVRLDPWGNVLLERDSGAPRARPEFVPMKVHMWVGCHNAPFFSLVHEPIGLVQVDCPPRARLARGSDSERFLRDPMDFALRLWYGRSPSPPPPPLPVHEPLVAAADARYAGPVSGLQLPAFDDLDAWMQAHVAAQEVSAAREGRTFNATHDETDLPSTGDLPTHIVMFDAVESRMEGWLQAHDFHLAARFFHCHLQGDVDLEEGQESGTVAVYRHTSWMSWALMAGRAHLSSTAQSAREEAASMFGGKKISLEDALGGNV